MTADRLIISGVSERDLDLLLMEEIDASASFRCLVMKAVDVAPPDPCDVFQVRRSVTHSSGESDLELDIEMADGSTTSILIENKVSSGFQPRQAERYRQRGESYVATNKCHIFRTILVAPARYLQGIGEESASDATLSYEAIDDWFSDHSAAGSRLRYKRSLLAAATERAVLRYQSVADSAFTDLWERYRRLAEETAPELVNDRLILPRERSSQTPHPVGLTPRDEG